MPRSCRGYIVIAEFRKETQMDYSLNQDCIGCYGVRQSDTHSFGCSVTNSSTVAPLLTIGLFGFSWTSLGPPHVHWIAPMIFSCLIAIANVCRSRSHSKHTGLLTIQQFSIYMATIDYMIASYGPYAASATGGNGFARDFLAGVAAMYSKPSKFPTGLTSRPSSLSPWYHS
jgi:hypothetical protein